MVPPFNIDGFETIRKVDDSECEPSFDGEIFTATAPDGSPCIIEILVRSKSNRDHLVSKDMKRVIDLLAGFSKPNIKEIVGGSSDTTWTVNGEAFRGGYIAEKSPKVALFDYVM